ncbi:hypothetical protein KM043_014801 [Ampulex compressa]|nr:hypothetical protein KM043_014801 [Ampulex compressa]
MDKYSSFAKYFNRAVFQGDNREIRSFVLQYLPEGSVDRTAELVEVIGAIRLKERNTARFVSMQHGCTLPTFLFAIKVQCPSEMSQGNVEMDGHLCWPSSATRHTALDVERHPGIG